MESRANPSSREASVPVETVRKERIMRACITARSKGTLPVHHAGASSPSPRSYGERVGVRGSIRECDGSERVETPPHPEFKLRLNSDLSPHPPSPEGGLRRTRAGRGGPEQLPLLLQGRS